MGVGESALTIRMTTEITRLNQPLGANVPKNKLKFLVVLHVERCHEAWPMRHMQPFTGSRPTRNIFKKPPNLL